MISPYFILYAEQKWKIIQKSVKKNDCFINLYGVDSTCHLGVHTWNDFSGKLLPVHLCSNFILCCVVLFCFVFFFLFFCLFVFFRGGGVRQTIFFWGGFHFFTLTLEPMGANISKRYSSLKSLINGFKRFLIFFVRSSQTFWGFLKFCKIKF